MKKIIAIIALGFVIITACMIYLLKSGISLRTTPIIAPSVVNPDYHNVAQGIALRLSPDFQVADYVLWGVLPETPSTQTILALTSAEYEKLFPGRKVHWVLDIDKASEAELRQCEKPCWILMPQEQANELTPHKALEEKIRPLQSAYFSISIFGFDKDQAVSDECIQQKRLTLECLKPLSIHESERKMKDKNARYFFMRKYNERDYFLFLQDEK